MKPQYWTKEKLEEALNRSDLAAEVTLPIEQARELFELVISHCYPDKTSMSEKVSQIIRDHVSKVVSEEKSLRLDKPKETLTDGSPVTPDHRELKENGQQKGYVVLSEEERARGFVRPVRHAYVHTGKDPIMDGDVIVAYDKPGCGTITTMNKAIAETYARDPKFYDGTFCACCGKHFPLDQFRWEGTDEVVGS